MPSSFLLPEISTSRLRTVERHEGGFGRVYIVQSIDGRQYALKTLKWELGLESEELATEASKLVDIPSHPHVIAITGLHWHDGVPFISMPVCTSTLRDLMPGGRAMGAAFAGAAALDIAEGLAHLHEEARVLHLDLKPQNVLLSDENTFVLSDFGISRALPIPAATGVHADLFISGVIGTVAYMSPEHFSTRRLSAKSDVFAFGAMLYEMLTGRYAFVAETYPKTAENILTSTPTFPSGSAELPSHLQNLCLACLEKNPDHRPTAGQVAAALTTDSGAAISAASRKAVDISATVNRATTLTQLKRFDEAQKLFETCRAQNPWYLPAVTNLAELYFLRGDLQRAAEIAEDAADLALWYPDPESVATLFTNLALYYLAFDPARAIGFARQATELDPNDWQAYGNIAEACRVLGDSQSGYLQEGLVACRHGLKLNPEDLKLQVTYGGLLLELDRLSELGPYVIDLVNKHGGDDPHLRFLLIRAFIACGQVEDAEAWLAPMRQYDELTPMVAQAEREMKAQRIRASGLH